MIVFKLGERILTVLDAPPEGDAFKYLPWAEDYLEGALLTMSGKQMKRLRRAIYKGQDPGRQLEVTDNEAIQARLAAGTFKGKRVPLQNADIRRRGYQLAKRMLKNAN